LKSEPDVVGKEPKRGFFMAQIHKRFTIEQVKILFRGYSEGNLSRAEIEEMLKIGKTRFFALLKKYLESPDTFGIAYQRVRVGRLSPEVESKIEKELLREQELIEDPEMLIYDYNYTALRDRLKKEGVQVSTTTITKRAKDLGCYKPKKKHKDYDREVLSHSIG
jgi:hypothetical protein